MCVASPCSLGMNPELESSHRHHILRAAWIISLSLLGGCSPVHMAIGKAMAMVHTDGSLPLTSMVLVARMYTPPLLKCGCDIC